MVLLLVLSSALLLDMDGFIMNTNFLMADILFIGYSMFMVAYFVYFFKTRIWVDYIAYKKSKNTKMQAGQNPVTKI